MKESFGTKFIDIFKSFRIWILIFMIFISYLTINYNFGSTGVVINGVSVGSAADSSGINFNSKANPRDFEEILDIDGKEIDSVEEYFQIVQDIEENSTITITTNKGEYRVNVGEFENESISDYIGLSVREEAKSNIRLGIEFEGGSRLILKPLQNITEEEFDLLVSNLESRLNIYGASGTKVNQLEDAFTNDKFVVVESTSSNKNDIYELISQQGEFEAKIGNTTVFTGENVIRVFNDPSHVRYERVSNNEQEVVYSVSFSLEIDGEGADKFFEETQKLSVQGQYLSEKVSFYLDGKEITSLSIGSSFKTQKITTPQISVTGNPASTESLAKDNAKKEMEFLRAILLTKSLPSDLEVEQSYSVSSSTGTKFLENAIIVGAFALLLVSGIVALRYRHIGIFIGIMIALIGEVIIVFGASALLSLTIDLVAIGGLIAAIGTGVDDQVIITDEYFRKKNSKRTSKKKIKDAFYIIMIAYLTTLAAMGPFLLSAGNKIIIYLVITIINIIMAVLFLVRLEMKLKYKLLSIVGFSAFTYVMAPLFLSPVLILLKGFAFMILIGVTVGVFITRPAYATILRIIMTTRKERKEEDEEEE